MYRASKPWWYDWLYSAATLDAWADAAATFLVNRGVQLYAQGCGGIRDDLAKGADHLLGRDAHYRRWSDAAIARFRSAYATSAPPSDAA